MSDNTDAAAKFVVSLFVLGCALATGLLWARVLQSLWAWFVTPTFTVAVPPFWTAYGLFLVAASFTHGLAHYESKAEDENERNLARVFRSIAAALTAWGLGSLAHMWGAA